MFSQAEALDYIIEKLKVIYFAKHGFTFPLSGDYVFLSSRYCANLGNGEDRVINIRLDLKRLIPPSWVKKDLNNQFTLHFVAKLNFTFQCVLLL